MPTVSSLTRRVLLGPVCFIALSSVVRGGLIIDVDREIDVAALRDVYAEDGDLVVESRQGRSIIELPHHALPLLALWARHHSGGPLVFSIEIASVSGRRNSRYYPPSTPPELVDAMFVYDAYHSDLSCGSFPEYPDEPHPLIAREGDDSAFPHRQQALLLRPGNGSKRAIWYRRLAARYVSPPECQGGQITISARAARGALPIKLEINSHRYVQTHSWYSKIDVMSEPDLWAAALPYEPLKEDIETRWEVYRQVFPPLDELSSIVEAFAILHAVSQQRERLWTEFSTRLYAHTDAIAPQPPEASWEPYLTYSYEDLDVDGSWAQLSLESIGDTVDTSEEANLALALLIQGSWIIDEARLREEIESFARAHPPIRAKWLLAKALESDPSAANELARSFFEVARNVEDGFRLRVDGLFLLRRGLTRDPWDDVDIPAPPEPPLPSGYDEEEDDWELEEPPADLGWGTGESPEPDPMDETGTASAPPDTAAEDPRAALAALLDQESVTILADFKERVSRNCEREARTSPDLLLWEDFTQDVYMTRFLELAADDWGNLDPEVAHLIACIHHRRGMAPQVGKNVFFRHAHFRFLKYLADELPYDTKLAEEIYRYRADIAQLLGLKGWEEPPHSYGDDPWQPEMVAGDLRPAACLFDVASGYDCDYARLGQGEPAGILSESGFTLLLVEAQSLKEVCSKRGGETIPARAHGTSFDRGRAFAPFRLEVLCDGSWQVIDLRRSDMTASDVEDGDE